MTTDPHIYQGEFCDLHIRPSDAPETVEVEVFSQKRKNGLWIEVPIAVIRSMLDASAPAGSYTRTDEDGLTLLMVQQQRDQATARTDKAERERDEAVERAEKHRPLTPEDFQALVQKAEIAIARRVRALDPSGRFQPSALRLADAIYRGIRDSQRPEGAEEWQEELDEMPAASDLTPEQRERLADALAERDHAMRLTGDES